MTTYFTPLVDFFDNDLRSAYVVGMNYQVRDQGGLDDAQKPILISAERTLLHRKVLEWVEAGKVRLGTADGGMDVAARVRGVAQVS